MAFLSPNIKRERERSTSSSHNGARPERGVRKRTAQRSTLLVNRMLEHPFWTMLVLCSFYWFWQSFSGKTLLLRVGAGLCTPTHRG
eukprot:5509442-Amphidinium_carterae.1